MADPRANTQESRMNPRRVEWVAIVGLFVQAFAALALGLLAYAAGGRALGILAVMALVGVGFWALAWLHLRLRRQAEEESDNLALADRQRRMAGMERLFDDGEEVNQAERNLSQMDRILAPAASIVLALALFAAPASYFLTGTTPWAAVSESIEINPRNALVSAAVSAGLAVALFLCGMYASGLAREKRREVIRAGGGFMLVTALFCLLSAMALGLGGQQWKLSWPDQLVSALALIWMTLQGVEILVNLVLNVYRPRVPGVQARPAYDSRLSGLFAEPTGLFKTFAHTLDYQFGFKISETWFFQFLERAFAPLLLIWFATFYLMTTMVVVRPGEVALIERFGAPRGVTLPAPGADESAWDALAVEPKGPGLHFKFPWPIETARVLPRERIQLLYPSGGHEGHVHTDDTYVDDGHGHAPPPKKDDHDDPMKLLSWSESHGDDEFAYLMPKPASWIEAENAGQGGEANELGRTLITSRTAPAGPREPLVGLARLVAANATPVNGLLMAGTFSLQYRIGAAPADVYRFAYRHQDPAAELAAAFEREITVHMAGAEFWTLLESGERNLQARLRETLVPTAKRLGIEIVAIQLQNIHPPAGDVGKAFQEVLAARQAKEAAIFGGWRDHFAAHGAVQSRIIETRAKAENYAFERVTVAKAEADRFAQRMTAYAIAPKAYVDQLRIAAIGAAMGKARVIVHPPGLQVRVDASREITGSTASLLTGVGEAIAREANQ